MKATNVKKQEIKNVVVCKIIVNSTIENIQQVEEVINICPYIHTANVGGTNAVVILTLEDKKVFRKHLEEFINIISRIVRYDEFFEREIDIHTLKKEGFESKQYVYNEWVTEVDSTPLYQDKVYNELKAIVDELLQS